MVFDFGAQGGLMTLAKWANDPGDLAIYWYIVLGDLQCEGDP